MAKKKIKTSVGFTFAIDESKLHDIRFFETIRKMKKADVDDQLDYSLELIEQLIGVEQKEAFYKYLEENSETGQATVEAVADTIAEVFNKVGDTTKK